MLELFAKVDDRYARHPAGADALGKREQAILSRSSIVPALEARSSASQHDDCALLARADDCHLAGVIARRLAILVAPLVLLVHDDRAEVLERREDRRSRADGDSLLASLEREPRVVPLAIAQRRMQHRHLITEHGAES